MQSTLEPTYFLDSDSPRIQAFARESIGDAPTDLEKGVRLFYAVRDGIVYSPYGISLDRADYRASAIVQRGSGYCVSKAIVLAAAARAVGIPARLGYADVVNHLNTPRLREMMKTDLFVYHGYTELFLGGVWIKATPTFNKSLCEKFGVRSLEFDGREDSLLQEFDTAGKKHMEYLRTRGVYDDFPLEELAAVWRETYPRFFEKGEVLGDFEAEAAEGSA
ncbi:MAG: transglutaminase family protein [Planctomycetota bacterium]|nr:transglutaminase family protein [Planctomycetota bacterium]